MSARTLLFALLTTCLLVHPVHSEVTVYGQLGQMAVGTGTESRSLTTVPIPTATLAAYNQRILEPPPIPNPPPPNQFGIQLAPAVNSAPGVSIPLSGAFYGFSIEMSVVTQVVGLNGSYIHPTFLNLMALIVERAGRVHIRIGGNTQETARMVPSLEDGKAIEKQKVDTNNPTQTPALLYTSEILYMLNNISALLNVKWYLGVPLNDSANLALDIIKYGEEICGDNVIGYQVGNEPDLYARHQHRPESYGPLDYFGEFGGVLAGMRELNVPRLDNILIGPSLATGDWTPEMVWDTGFIEAYGPNLQALTVEHYPSDNCAEIYPGFGTPKDPQAEFPRFLTHQMALDLVRPYLNSTMIAQSVGKPFIMFETNSASCGGFSGVSTSFGAALWALDYGLEMAASNFSHALLHVGGQNVYYNPFTAVPTNQSHIHQWTVGPIFYSVLAVSETLGSSNTSQVLGLGQNDGNLLTPGYAIYEHGTLVRVALINFMDDPSGANDYTVSISIGGGLTGQPVMTPEKVRVKYLVAPSVSNKFNITWGGQTLGGQFEADGRLKGEMRLETIECDQAANVCRVRVPAPGFALVFLSDEAVRLSQPDNTVTFATSVLTKFKNTVTIDEAALATSNGNRGMEQMRGSTSFGSGTSAAVAAAVGPGALTVLGMAVGAATVLRAWLR